MRAQSRETVSEHPALWITWERHRRTRELSRALGIELCELTSKRGRAVRYAWLLLRTALCLVRRRPSLVVIQCPSVILGVWAALLKPLLRYQLVSDLHNEAVVPFNVTRSAYRALLAFIHRASDLSLVSNANLCAVVEGHGGNAFVLPDKLPDLRPRTIVASSATRTVVFVCTFAPDEPFREVIEAARRLEASTTVFVTGNHRRSGPLHPPDNVYLTGYVSERDYIALLQMADVIVDLTAMDDCLVCGAYEAASLGKPLVTSDTSALREYFHRGTVYTKHDPASLAAAMTYALEHTERLAADMRTLRVELTRDWASQCDALRRRLRLGGTRAASADFIPLPMRH